MKSETRLDLNIPKNVPSASEDVVGEEEFSHKSRQVTCQTCQLQVKTDVSSDLTSSGWTLVILFCLLGWWLVSCLVTLLPGFKKYTHHCPRCRAFISLREPTHSACHLASLLLASITTITFVALLLC